MKRVISLVLATKLCASYVQLSDLHPGQMRYSSQNVEMKVTRAIANGRAIFDGGKSTYRGKFFGGKSLFDESEALPVVKAQCGYVLVDGHHNVLSALKLNITSIPIRITADLSHLSIEEFWDFAERQGYIHRTNLDGKPSCPLESFEKLCDDPNRYFAAITARKYSADLRSSTGALYPLWIKIGKDVPFIEFHIADALYKAGFVYKKEWGENPPEEAVERAREILQEANIDALKLVLPRTHYEEIAYD